MNGADVARELTYTVKMGEVCRAGKTGERLIRIDPLIFEHGFVEA